MNVVCNLYFETGEVACLNCPLTKKGCRQQGFVTVLVIEDDEDLAVAAANHLGLRAKEVPSEKGTRRFKLW